MFSDGSRHRRLRAAWVALLTVASLGAAATVPGAASATFSAAPVAVAVAPTVGPPTSSVVVSASGFLASERVDVFFDSTATTLGSFAATTSGAATGNVTVPAWAKPKTHSFIARGRTSQRQATASFLVRADWPQPDFDAGRSRFNPYENVLNGTTLATLHPVWHIAPGDQCTASFGTVAYGMMYVGGCQNPDVTAYDAATGRVRWHAFVPGQDWTSGPPTVANGRVYVVTEDVNTLDAVDAFTGALLWSTDLDGLLYPQSPAAAGGLVIAEREAFDARTGALRWQVPPDDPHGCGVDRARDVTVTISANEVYMRCVDGSLERRSLATGALLSVRPSSNSGTLPVVVNGVMYYGSVGRMVARDAATGTLRWQTVVANSAGQPAVGRGMVFAAVGTISPDRVCGGCAVEALDAATGTPRWVRNVGTYVSGGPIVAGGVVYVRTSCTLLALDVTTGRPLRSLAITCGGGLGPVVNGVVYAGAEALAP